MLDRPLGVGVSWRPEMALAIERYPRLGFVEVVAENLDPEGPLPAAIENLRRRGLPVIPHGVSLSLGNAERPNATRLQRLAKISQRLQAPLVSEHVAFVRADGIETGHLLPVPRTHDMLEVLVENVRIAQSALPVPLALENIATLVEWPQAELDEAEFLTRLVERTGVLLLLDVENVYANSRNHGFDAEQLLRRLPLSSVAYVHVAGGVARDGLYHDTHQHPIPPPVFDLLAFLAAQIEIPGVALERDDRFPPQAELWAELDAIGQALVTARRCGTLATTAARAQSIPAACREPDG